MILGGDIGGTKTNLALFEKDHEKLKIIHEEKYSSKGHSSLEEIVQDFIHKYSAKVDSACFGIAGPVKDGEVKTTNLAWDVKSDSLSKSLSNAKVIFLNDLEANAWGIDELDADEFHVLQKGTGKTKGNRALISAGTGLGEAGLYFDGKEYHPFATEGGHADFSPRSGKEIALLKHLSKSFEHVSYERVLSGQGLYNIYQFLKDYHNSKTSKEMAEEMKKNDPAIVISKKALDNSDPLSVEALEVFVDLYGAEAGNCALRYMAYGGVYLGGGIAPKIIEKLEKSNFLNSFLNKGRFKPLLETFTIKVILNDKTALLGAGRCAKHFS